MLSNIRKYAMASFKLSASIVFSISMIIVSTAQSVSAIPFGDGSVQSGVDAARGNDVPSSLLGDGGILTQIINAMLMVVGFLSVIMLIYGGLRYIISGGKPEAVTSAKNTILYSIVGLLVALFAYAIINFLIDSLVGGGAGGTNR